MYLLKTPFWLRWLYPGLTWRMPGKEKVIYLTFDDGPHPEATPFVLDLLKQYDAKASFFCIGKNVVSYPGIYQRILDEGHAVGNHTYHHLNGWKTSNDEYLADIQACQEILGATLFRPPYGKIRRSQIARIAASYKLQAASEKEEAASYKLQAASPSSPLPTPYSLLPTNIIMWSVLSGDFDPKLTPEACLSYVLNHTRPGSIVVFHDSTKAWERMRYALPKVLEHFSKAGYTFKSINKQTLQKRYAIKQF